MRPRIRVPLMPAGRVWSRHTIGAAVLVLAGVLAVPVFKQDSNGGFEARASNDGFEARVQSDTFKSTCAPWDGEASEAIVRLVQGSRDEVLYAQSAMARAEPVAFGSSISAIIDHGWRDH